MAHPVSITAVGQILDDLNPLTVANKPKYDALKTKLITSLALAAVACAGVVFSGLFMLALPQTIILTFYASSITLGVSTIASIYFGYKMHELTKARSQALSDYSKISYGEFVEKYQKKGHVTENEAISLLYKELRSTRDIMSFLKRHKGADFLDKIIFSCQHSKEAAKQQILSEIKPKLLESIPHLQKIEDIQFIPKDFSIDEDVKPALANFIYNFFCRDSFTLKPKEKDKSLSFALREFGVIFDTFIYVNYPHSGSQLFSLSSHVSAKLFQDYPYPNSLNLFKDYKLVLKTGILEVPPYFRDNLTRSASRLSIESIVSMVEGVEDIFLYSLNESSEFMDKVDGHFKTIARDWLLSKKHDFLRICASTELDARLAEANAFYTEKKHAFDAALKQLEQDLAQAKAHKKLKKDADLNAFKEARGFLRLEAALEESQRTLTSSESQFREHTLALKASKDRHQKAEKDLRSTREIIAYFQKAKLSFAYIKSQRTALEAEISDLNFLSQIQSPILQMLSENTQSIGQLEEQKRALKEQAVLGMVGVGKNKKEMASLEEKIHFAKKCERILSKYPTTSEFFRNPQTLLRKKQTEKAIFDRHYTELTRLGCQTRGIEDLEAAQSDEKRLYAILRDTSEIQRLEAEIGFISRQLEPLRKTKSFAERAFLEVKAKVDAQDMRLESICAQEISSLDQAFGREKTLLEQRLDADLQVAITMIAGEVEAPLPLPTPAYFAPLPSAPGWEE